MPRKSFTTPVVTASVASKRVKLTTMKSLSTPSISFWNESEQKKAGEFKKKFILKKTTNGRGSSDKFLRSRKQEVVTFLKTLNLKKLKTFVDEVLTQKEGFYRFPISKKILKYQCPYNDKEGEVNKSRADSENSDDSCLPSEQKKRFFEKTPTKSRSKTPKARATKEVTPRKKLKVTPRRSSQTKVQVRFQRKKSSPSPQKKSKSKKMILLKKSKAANNLECWSNHSDSEEQEVNKIPSKKQKTERKSRECQKSSCEEIFVKTEEVISLDSEKADSHSKSVLNFSGKKTIGLESKLAKVEKERNRLLRQLRARRQKKQLDLSKKIKAAEKKLKSLMNQKEELDGEIKNLDKSIGGKGVGLESGSGLVDEE